MSEKKKSPTIKVGDRVQIIGGVSEWEKALTHFVCSVEEGEIVVSTLPNGGKMTKLTHDDIIKI